MMLHLRDGGANCLRIGHAWPPSAAWLRSDGLDARAQAKWCRRRLA